MPSNSVRLRQPAMLRRPGRRPAAPGSRVPPWRRRWPRSLCRRTRADVVGTRYRRIVLRRPVQIELRAERGPENAREGPAVGTRAARGGRPEVAKLAAIQQVKRAADVGGGDQPDHRRNGCASSPLAHSRPSLPIIPAPVCAHQDCSPRDSVGTTIAISPVVQQRSSGSSATVMPRTLDRNFDGARRPTISRQSLPTLPAAIGEVIEITLRPHRQRDARSPRDEAPGG